MTKNTTLENENILKLLAMTAFADKRLLSVEITAFVNVVIDLQNTGIMSSDYTEAQLFIWFETHKIEIKSELSQRGFEPWLYSCLDNLSEFENKKALFEAMFKVAYSDDEEHISETALAVLVAKYWDIDPNIVTTRRLIA